MPYLSASQVGFQLRGAVAIVCTFTFTFTFLEDNEFLCTKYLYIPLIGHTQFILSSVLLHEYSVLNPSCVCVCVWGGGGIEGGKISRHLVDVTDVVNI